MTLNLSQIAAATERCCARCGGALKKLEPPEDVAQSDDDPCVGWVTVSATTHVCQACGNRHITSTAMPTKVLEQLEDEL